MSKCYLFTDDLDDAAELSFHADEDVVAVIISGDDNTAPVDVYLTPEKARKAAQALTLVSMEAEGSTVGHVGLGDDAEGTEGADEVLAMVPNDRAAVFLAARILAGEDASPHVVLDVARFLAGDKR